MIIAIVVINTLACEEDDSGLSDASKIILLVTASKSATNPNITFVNNSGVTGTAGLYTDSACMPANEVVSVTGLTDGSTSSALSFVAGSYYAGNVGDPDSCSEIFFYSNGYSYTMTV